MPDLHAVLHFAGIYFLLMGIVVVVGGVIGFIKAKSLASLVAGGVSGFLLILSAALLPADTQVGLILALLVSFGLAARFVPALFRGKIMPAGYVAPLALLGVLIALWLLLELAGLPLWRR